MIALSEIDQARFGIVIARATVKTVAEREEALAFCARHGVELLIARMPALTPFLGQPLLAEGALLTDTLCVFSRASLPEDALFEAPADIVFRRASPKDAEAVALLAARAFHDYPNHYWADPNLDRDACNAVLPDWGSRLCASDGKTVSWIAEGEGNVVGFLGSDCGAPDVTHLGLGMVEEDWRGRGILLDLLRCQLSFDASRGAVRTLYPTQLWNMASLRCAVRLGYIPMEGYHTVHHWFPARSRPSAG